MGTVIKIPFLDQSITEVVLGEWLKDDGDHVAAGEELLSVITDKSNIVLEAEDAGVLKMLAKASSTIPIGYIVGMLIKPGESIESELAQIAQHNRNLMDQTRNGVAP